MNLSSKNLQTSSLGIIQIFSFKTHTKINLKSGCDKAITRISQNKCRSTSDEKERGYFGETA